MHHRLTDKAVVSCYGGPVFHWHGTGPIFKPPRPSSAFSVSRAHTPNPERARWRNILLEILTTEQSKVPRMAPLRQPRSGKRAASTAVLAVSADPRHTLNPKTWSVPTLSSHVKRWYRGGVSLPCLDSLILLLFLLVFLFLVCPKSSPRWR